MNELQEKINQVKQLMRDIAVLCENEVKVTTARFSQNIADAELQMIEKKRMLEEEFHTIELAHQEQMRLLVTEHEELQRSVSALKHVAQQLRAVALTVQV